MRTVEINVTAEHISDGDVGECTSCPIALAIKEVVPASWVVDVHFSGLDSEGGWYSGATFETPTGGPFPRVIPVSLPPVAADFIARFDDGQDVEPFTFTMQVPDEVAA